MVALRGCICAPTEGQLELQFGARVSGTDGPLGRLRDVLLEAGALRVSSLSIQADRWGSPGLRVPLEAVVGAAAGQIRLPLSRQAALDLSREQDRQTLPSGLPAADLVTAETPLAERLHTAVTLRHGCKVTALDGAAGRLRALRVDHSVGTVEAFVIEDGCISPRRRRLPVGWIRGLTGSTLLVNATRAAIARLPQFRTDLELRGAILDAWFYDDFLRPLHLCGTVNVLVHEEVAEVAGYAWSRWHRHRLEARARLVPGVHDVRCSVVTDDELVRDVELALRQDPRTCRLRPHVESELGSVCLKGETPDRFTREAASEVAGSLSPVRAVQNHLRVIGGGGSLLQRISR